MSDPMFSEWERWFAWRPVRLTFFDERHIVWLQHIQRRYDWFDDRWQYRRPESVNQRWLAAVRKAADRTGKS